MRNRHKLLYKSLASENRITKRQEFVTTLNFSPVALLTVGRGGLGGLGGKGGREGRGKRGGARTCP